MELITELELGDGDFRRFAGLVYASSGIHLTEQKRELLKARLRKRLRALGLGSYRDYFNLVTADGPEGELRALLDVVSTNKTEFFRESKHFDHLAEVVIPDWLARGGARQGPFRIWSAASSTGEEVWTLAMTVMEALNGQADFKVLGTDISTRVLEKALGGVYEDRHIEAIPEERRRRYFVPLGDGHWQVGDALRAKASFGRLNLNDSALPFHNPFDAVFCRNVMIYFDRPTQEALVERIHGALTPGGWLYTGLSESLLAVKHSFKTVAPSVYRKAL